MLIFLLFSFSPKQISIISTNKQLVAIILNLSGRIYNKQIRKIVMIKKPVKNL
jgi:hypothetical protein